MKSFIALAILAICMLVVGCTNSPTGPMMDSVPQTIAQKTSLAFEGSWDGINSNYHIRMGSGLLSIFSGSNLVQQEHFAFTSYSGGIYMLTLGGGGTQVKLTVDNTTLIFQYQNYPSDYIRH